MHPYNTRQNKNYVAPKQEPDEQRITVSGRRNSRRPVRLHCSQDAVSEDNDSEASPSEYSGESSTSGDTTSGDTEIIDNDGDSVMRDNARFVTPQRDIPYRPGSVVETPKKGRIIRQEPRVGGGFNFWHKRDGAVLRLSFGQNGLPVAAVAEGGNQQPPPNDPHLMEAIVDCSRSVSPESDAGSVASDATVVIDPRATPQPTLFNGAMPLIRHPTWPEGFDPNAPGPSRGQTGRLDTIREGSEEVQWPPRIPDQHPGMRILRDADGQWVREGSQDPDAVYHIDTRELPPRIDREQAPAPQPVRRPRVNRAEVVITTTPPHRKR
ncbi:hypothetical protein TRAPUB_2722 [Trametes pubescens]|uniref:Uncharacterized protein n=1 Tax=Trametes pubescens TaxID=154538 RepID=A0A1M2VFZ4_TRAPU|nr:hypothetical protein TRAPUB_2722 [Trametes pubescens]